MCVCGVGGEAQESGFCRAHAERFFLSSVDADPNVRGIMLLISGPEVECGVTRGQGCSSSRNMESETRLVLNMCGIKVLVSKRLGKCKEFVTRTSSAHPALDHKTRLAQLGTEAQSSLLSERTK